jgi:hypothetical protein
LDATPQGESGKRGVFQATNGTILILTARFHLRIQGKYMGTMTGLPARRRAIVKKARADKGIRAAVATARRMAGGGVVSWNRDDLERVSQAISHREPLLVVCT